MTVRALLFSFSIACGGTIAPTTDGGADAAPSSDASASGKGIACKGTSCAPETEMCCVRSASTSCVSKTAGDCSGQVFRIACDDQDDCAGQSCCFTNVLSSAQAATVCASSCSGFGMTQVCKKPSDCPNGTCNTFECGGSFGSGTIVLGLCTATAPMFCK